jgi:hypothetical protein
VSESDPLTGAKRKFKVSILVRWEKLQKLLSGTDERVRRYKEELFGSAVVEEFPDEYNELNVIKKAGSWVDFYKFKELPIHLRAKLMAHTYLESIVEILQRHDSLQKQKIRQMENRASSNQNG